MQRLERHARGSRAYCAGYVLALAAVLLYFPTEIWGKSGLQTKFGIVTIENLQPGRMYNTREIANLPMVIRNTGDERVTVKIAVLLPASDSPGMIQNDYRVIPSTSWVTVVNDELEIDAGESKGSDILIKIPDEDQYLGKRYQVDFHVRTLTKKFIAVGLRSNLRITVAHRRETKEEAREREKLKLYEDIDFDLIPHKVLIKNVAVGRKVNLAKEKNVTLKISNPNDTDFLYYLDVVRFRDVHIGLPGGFSELPSEMVILKKKNVRVKQNSIKKIKLAVKIPDKDEHRGMKYIFAIRGRVAGTPVELNQVSRFLLTTEKKKDVVE